MLAPSVWNILLTFEFCNAKPIWIPRNPKLMFQICQKLNLRFSIIVIYINDKRYAYQN
jgi:hypothetical protein